MALPKLYEQITWVNDTTPALNEDNLNAMSQALDDIDDRVIDLAGTIMEDVPQIQEDMAILGPAVENIDSNVARAEAAAESAEQYAEEISPPIEVVKDFAPIITIEDAINKPVKDLKIKIEAVQSGSGTPSPDNVRPITGHSEAKVTRAGKNVCPKFPATGSTAGVNYTTKADGAVTAVGTSTGQTGFFAMENGKLPTGQYILSAGNEASTNLRVVVVITRESGNVSYIEATSSTEKTFSVYDTDQKVAIYIRTNGGNTAINGTLYPMIRRAEFADGAYEPYMGEVFTIDLGGTRYGGVLDVDEGTLTLTHGMVDMGDLSWLYQSDATYPRFFADITNIKAVPDISTKGDIICSDYETITAGSGYGGTKTYGAAVTPNAQVWTWDPRYTDAATYKTAMSGVQLVYELATPQTITLTAEEVQLLWAYNTLFADTGDISLTYDASGVLRIANGKLDIDTFKAVVAASSDFADFKTRVAVL